MIPVRNQDRLTPHKIREQLVAKLERARSDQEAIAVRHNREATLAAQRVWDAAMAVTRFDNKEEQ